MVNLRKPLRIPIASIAQISSHGLHREIEVFIRDISPFGLGGYMDCSFEKGEMLKVRLKLTTPRDGIIEESIMGQIK